MPLKQVASFSVSSLQILDENGQVDEKLDPRLPPEQAVQLYEAMVRAREVDQRMLRLQRQGRLGTCPLCTGQEAAVCGPALAMSDRDWFVGYYRELGARLMRGESMALHFRYWNGQEEGNCQPEKRRNLPVTAIIGAQTLHAVGIAYAMQYQGEQESAVVTFFGDGATSEGDVHEAMNFAAVWRAPVVFICLNNQWAISHPRDKQTISSTIAQKAIGYGFEGIQVDGNDVLGMYRATRAAIERAYAGGGPTLIEAITYRLMMHTTSDDPKRYRDEAEVADWWEKDPLRRYNVYLRGRGLWDDARQAELDERIKREIDEAVRQAEYHEPLPPDSSFNHVFGTPCSQIEAQRAEFLARLQRGGSDVA